MEEIKSFEDLNIWKEAHYLTLEIYRIAQLFPKDEMFGLTLQLKRVAYLFQQILLKEWAETPQKN